MSLPILAIRDQLLAAIQHGPVVLSAPTGSGKSTMVPQWMPGRVLVVEPRRVACRSLARRVAELLGATPGQAVGYSIRDDHQASAKTRITFVTPGIALRILQQDNASAYDTVILDEFHERTLDVDLTLALIQKHHPGRLVVMSATLQGERLATHLGGAHIQGKGRAFPVQIHHHPFGAHEPQTRAVEDRVAKGIRAALEHPGDVLVFLPGKGEIRGVAARLGGLDLEVLQLHGGLSSREQDRIFHPGQARRVILATNVAETSLTVPRIGVVVDSGLVRQTRYHNGRAYLGLCAIAKDSADQRAGRAGRLGPGVCLRLWDSAAPMQASTLPEIHREALPHLVLAAAACGAKIDELPFVDTPRPYAVAEALEELQALGALDADGVLTPRGRTLSRLPLDPQLGRLVLEAQEQESKERGGLADVVDLVATLSVNRPLWRQPWDPEDDTDPRAQGCDGMARILLLRGGHRSANPEALREARQNAKRLRAAFDVPAGGPPDRDRLVRLALAANPRSAYIRRQRGKRTSWSAGGTEVELGRDSCVDAERTQGLLSLEERGFGAGRDRTLRITAALRVSLQEMATAGIGRERPSEVRLKRGVALAKLELVHAGRVLSSQEKVPRGAMAWQVLATLLLRGTWLKGCAKELRARLSQHSIWRELDAAGHLQTRRGAALFNPPSAWVVPETQEFVLQRLEELGVSSGEDASLIEAQDMLPDPLPEDVSAHLAQAWPATLSFPEARYTIAYAARTKRVTLTQVHGRRKDPPPGAWLPSWTGWRLSLVQNSRVVQIKR